MQAAIAVAVAGNSIDAVIGIDNDGNVARAVGDDGLEDHIVAVGDEGVAIGARHRRCRAIGTGRCRARVLVVTKSPAARSVSEMLPQLAAL